MAKAERMLFGFSTVFSANWNPTVVTLDHADNFNEGNQPLPADKEVLTRERVVKVK
jgi:hypothetical protein